MKAPWCLCLLALIVSPCGFAVAQSSGSPRKPPILPVQFGPVFKSAPVSAIRVLDFEPAPGVDARPVHGEEKLYRDSEGRTRHEIRYNGGPATILLLDHVAHTELTWHEGQTVAQRLPLKEYPVAEPKTASYGDHPPMIEGIPTKYTRSTDRNDPKTTIEGWYSAELQMSLATIIDTPDWGKTSYRFTQIQRGEPDAKLFRLPDGMTEQTAGMPPPPPVLLADTTHAAAVPSQPGIPPPPYASDPKFQKAYDEALHGGLATNDEQMARWKKVVKLSDGKCVECLKRLIQLQNSTGASKDEQRSAEQLEAVATTPADKFVAQLKQGQALMHSNFGQPKRPEAEKAETKLAAALAIAPRNTTALFEHGRALAMLGRDGDAKDAFQKYTELSSETDQYHLRAERYVENPHLAALPAAPPFKLVTAQGEELQLDDMHGKVVLLDFWATWCGPCKASLPELQRVAKDFKDEPLMLISISSDRDAAAWKQYVQQHNMDWPQYRDANGALSRAYGVDVIPHYFTIDADGVLQTEMVGSGADIRGKLKKLLKQAHDHAPRQQTVAAK